MQNTSIRREDYPRSTAQEVRNVGLTPPPTQLQPIQQEFEELRDAVETLEKEHYNLAGKLQPVISIDQSESKKQDHAATEPSTGCEVKDKLANLKQRVLYIKRMTVDLQDRIWL